MQIALSHLYYWKHRHRLVIHVGELVKAIEKRRKHSRQFLAALRDIVHESRIFDVRFDEVIQLLLRLLLRLESLLTDIDELDDVDRGRRGPRSPRGGGEGERVALLRPLSSSLSSAIGDSDLDGDLEGDLRRSRRSS